MVKGKTNERNMNIHTEVKVNEDSETESCEPQSNNTDVAGQSDDHVIPDSDMTILREKIRCISMCKLNGLSTKKMVQCCMCLELFHLECINIKLIKELPKIWNCLRCRTLPVQIESLMNKFAKFEESMILQANQLNELNKLHKECVRTNANLSFDLQTSNESLRLAHEENKNLQLKLIKLEAELLREKNSNSKSNSEINDFHQARNLDDFKDHSSQAKDIKHFLIGSSIIRDTTKTTGDLQIRSHGGATVLTLVEQLSSYPDNSFSAITMVVGSNDCDCQIEEEKFMDNYNTLINHAKRISTGEVRISSVCPRVKGGSQYQNKVIAINKSLKQLAEKRDCIFINNDTKFSSAGWKIR